MRADALLRDVLGRNLAPVLGLAWSALVLGVFSLGIVHDQQQLAVTLLVTLAALFATAPTAFRYTASPRMLLRTAPGTGPPVPFDSPLTDVPRHPCRPRAPGRA